MRLLAFLLFTVSTSLAIAGSTMGEGGIDGENENPGGDYGVSAAGQVLANPITMETGEEVLLTIDANQLRPSLMFGPALGCYANSDGNIRCVANNRRWLVITGIRFGSTAPAGSGSPGAGDSWELTNQAATATVPSLCPRGDVGGDTDTGVGGAADGEANFISDASEKLTINPSGVSTPLTTKTPAGGAVSFAATHGLQIVDCDAGGNTISTISGADDGTMLRLLFVDASCTLSDSGTYAAGTLALNGNFVSADDKVLELMAVAGSWYEVFRSTN